MAYSLRKFIPSGEYAVKESGEELLVALLGTCVGVAIYDKQNGIGGLIHLLLPEPTGTATAWQPLNYARTGLPLFIEELLNKGARRENLEACIAGGALFGPISNIDIDLDIGGRTAEITHDILNQEGITIIRAETGGYFGAQLTLDTSNWQVDIEPTIKARETQNKEARKPTEKDVDEAIMHTHSIPQVALKIIRLLRTENYNIHELTREINFDQVIVAKVLQLCNSPMIGATHPIDSLERALLLMGENHLLEIVVSASLDRYFTSQEGGYSFMRGGLYHHALGVANVAKIITEYTGRAEPSTAYTAGLLHDIGKVVLDQFISAAYPLFYRAAKSGESGDLVSLEKEILGTDHQEVGKKLAQKWNFPENLTEVISMHHYPENAANNSELVHIVHLADLLTSYFLSGLDFERINSDDLLRRLHRLGLAPVQLPVIIDRVPWHRMIFN